MKSREVSLRPPTPHPSSVLTPRWAVPVLFRPPKTGGPQTGGHPRPGSHRPRGMLSAGLETEAPSDTGAVSPPEHTVPAVTWPVSLAAPRPAGAMAPAARTRQREARGKRDESFGGTPDGMRVLGAPHFSSSAPMSVSVLSLSARWPALARIVQRETRSWAGAFREGPGTAGRRDSRANEAICILPGPRDTSGDCPRESCHGGRVRGTPLGEPSPGSSRDDSGGVGWGWGALAQSPNPAGLGRAPECSRYRSTTRTSGISKNRHHRS